jgi:hypothetical protein
MKVALTCRPQQHSKLLLFLPDLAAAGSFLLLSLLLHLVA